MGEGHGGVNLLTDCKAFRSSEMGTLMNVVVLLCAVIGLVLPFLTAVVASRPSRVGLFIDGDIIIGGLIPVHFSPNFPLHPGASTCQGAFHLRGYKGVEAMLYAVDLINNRSTLLPNVTLGVDIKDTCGSVDYAIMECLRFDFIRSAFSASESSQCEKRPEGRERDKRLSTGDKTLNGSFADTESDSEYWLRKTGNGSGILI